MTNTTEDEQRIARDLRRQARANNAERREKEKDDRFNKTREHFRRNVAAWNQDRDQAQKSQTLRVHRDVLHRRLLWTANDALDWCRTDSGAYFLDTAAIDRLHKPMALMLQFVKAEHKIAQDRAALALRARQFDIRAARMAAAKKEEKNLESAERPHTPELSA